MSASSKEIQDGKFFAAIAYVCFFCILTFWLKKDNKFAVHHAKQGLVLFVAEAAAFILTLIPLLEMFIKTAGYALFVGVSIWGIVHACRGVYSKIPFVWKVAEGIVL